MHKNLITPLILICTLYFSCSNKSQPNPQNGGSDGIKISLVSGGNQTDTTGWLLPNPIVVKVTQNGTAVSNYNLVFEGSGCNDGRMDKYATKADGTVNYYWYLAGDLGQQSLKVIAVDANNKRVDSLTVNSTAIAAGSGGWHTSACTYPFGFSITALCKSGAGRLFTSFSGGPTYLKYSDDNGVSWNTVKALGSAHRFESVGASSANEVFAAADDGNFYSADNGQTWTTLPAQGFDFPYISGIIFTSSGNIFALSLHGSSYVSSDKGKTWTAATHSGDDSFVSPSEDQNGNLYFVGQTSGLIYKSADVGKTWKTLNFPNDRFVSLFIDKNNWFYASDNGFRTYGIYISKDNAVNFNLMATTADGFNDNISVQADGNLYFNRINSGLFRFNSTAGPAKLIFYIASPPPTPYIMAGNGSLISVNSSAGLSYSN